MSIEASDCAIALSFISPFQGFLCSWSIVSQGDALGYCISPLRGWIITHADDQPENYRKTMNEQACWIITHVDDQPQGDALSY
jgi:hypothetical protein